jgi:protoheme IX farnesyltransferase
MRNKDSVNVIAGTLPVVESQTGWQDWWELTKPRLSLMSVATVVLGYLAAGPRIELVLFFALTGGTTLAAFGAAALNQWWERDADARMERTANRPLAAGRIGSMAGLAYGLTLALAGCGLLLWKVDLLVASLTALTVVLYVLAYTPLKRVTPLATEIGAIPGALPPLIGWLAAGAGFSTMGWVLFAILFAWQLPHFMAISWMCREDYERGGFAMLAVRDPSGARVARRAFAWVLVLCLIGFLPLREAGLGWVVGITNGLLCLLLLQPAWTFLRSPESKGAARRLFLATLLYLPAYLGALVVDRFII